MDPQEQRLRLVLDNLPALVAFLNTEQRLEFANRLHFSWFGTEPAKLIGLHVREVVGEDAYTMLKPHYEEALSGKESAFMGMVPYASGGYRYIHGTATPLVSTAGDIEGILVQVSDLTEQKLIEKELDAAMLRCQTVLDTAVDGIITIDEKGIIQSCNASTQKMFGYTAKEMIGQNITMLMPSPYAENHDDYLARYLSTGEKRIIGIGREVTGKRKDGSEFPMELAVGEFIEDGQHYFTGFTRDITDRKMSELNALIRLDDLAHVTRLNAIHNLATGISHEINQPLTAVVTMAQALIRTHRAGSLDPVMLASTLDKIVRQSVRASNIMHNMREFIGKDNLGQKSLHNIESIINDVLQLLEHEIVVNNIMVKKQFHDSEIQVNVNRIQIEQVILNLVKNAVEAMSEVQDMRILTIKIPEPQAGSDYMQVFIEDTGPGLPEKAGCIFDNFFTTKINGMGQGLSICRSIVEAHGGSINTSPGHHHGTVFYFSLPLELPVEN